MSQSPIERFLDAVDRLDVDAAMALMAPDARVLVADCRRAEGTEAVRQLFGDFLGQLRSTTHRITAQWHQEDVWIAEVAASYELRDWLQLNGLPRAFVVRASPDGRIGVEGLRRTRTSALQSSLARPIVTEIAPASPFYDAEEYHQRYFEKHGGAFCATTVR